MILFVMILFDMILFDMILFDMILFDMILFDMILFDMILFDMILFDMILFDMILFDRYGEFCQAAHMSRLTRKFVAVLMLLWLPLSGGSALAATVSMQAQSGACHEMSMQEMHFQDASEHQHHHAETPVTQDQSDSSHSTCGVCHLACSSYLAVPAIDAIKAQAPAHWVTPYLLSFHSVTSTPIVPPPLARV